MQFLHFAATRRTEIAQTSVAQIEKSVQEDEAARLRQVAQAKEGELDAQLLQLQNERDALITFLAGVPDLIHDASSDVRDKAATKNRISELNEAIALIQKELAHQAPGRPTTES